MDQLPPRRRRRPALSCLECRRRKIRCDRANPCGHCTLVKLRCEFPEYHGPPRPPRSDTSASEKAVPSVQVTPEEAPFAKSTPQSTAGTVSLQGSSNAGSGPPIQPISNSDEGALKVILDKGRVSSYRAGIASAFEPILACYTAATGISTYLTQASQEGCAVTHSFQGVDTFDDITRLSELLQQSKLLSREIKAGLATGCVEDELLLQPRAICDAMARLYFATFESTTRILHAGTFWSEYERFWTPGESVSPDQRLRVLLVVALGSSIFEHPDGLTRVQWYRRANHWLRSAESWLKAPLKGARRSLGGIQIHCLVFVARGVFSINDGDAWVATGSFVHEAMRAGLHRDPKHLPNLSCLEMEVRRRLWATILELVAQSSLDTAMPPRISLDEYDTEAPANINDSDLERATTTVEAQPLETTYTDTSLQIVLLESVPTRLRILQKIYGLGADIPYSDVLSLSAEMISACRRGSTYLARHETQANAGMMAFRRNLLDFLVRRFLLALHCPYATKAPENPLYESSVKSSLDAAMSILSPEPNETFARLLAVSGGLFKNALRNAMMTIGMELLVQVERQRLDGTLHRSQQYRMFLAQKLEEMIDLSVRRISHGETNIKGPMFLGMILALAEAGVTGSSASVEVLVARAARVNLEMSYGLLQVLADEVGVPTSPGMDDGTLPSLTCSEDWEDAMGGMNWDMDLFFPRGGMYE
ncbi:hypothetical protein B0T11DRAFT_272835 [Plectosphaerella cucumerina]|uniref:Zn(2)-C6 fungal-type domain-containing protein n=1 Tax=Plectosphaerella cucumerina TaxID=40658 RepID=A0A8K0TW66_9PEZI|nr:hypothetical protein B0T11DRAFT_272835 [Plectosphaerella cucumerina]